MSWKQCGVMKQVITKYLEIRVVMAQATIGSCGGMMTTWVQGLQTAFAWAVSRSEVRSVVFAADSLELINTVVEMHEHRVVCKLGVRGIMEILEPLD